MKKLSLLGIVVLGLFFVTGSALAANATAPLTIGATVATTAKLALDSASVSFANADPDTTPSITASPDPVNVTAKAKTTTSGSVTLTVATGGDLTLGL